MFLTKKKKPQPDAPRSTLQQAAAAGAAPGQRILAFAVAIISALLILGGVAWKYVWPVYKGTPAAPAPAAPQPEPTKTEPKLAVPLDMDAAAPQAAAPTGSEVFAGAPGLNPDAQPSQHPSTPQPTTQIGGRTQPPGMSGEPVAYQQGDQGGSDERALAQKRKLSGDLGYFGEPNQVQRRDARQADDADVEDDEMAIQREIARRKVAAGIQPAGRAAPAPAPTATAPAANEGGAANGLAAQLTPISTPNGSVGIIPHPHLTVQKGEPLTCTLDTAIATDQFGFVECLTDYPLKSMDGKVVLAERGSRIQGEYSRSMVPGSNAIFVLWTKGTTPAPNHVEFSLMSPGSDKLGRSGIQGEVDNKFWQRYGGALMFSVLQDVSTAAASKAAGGGSNSPVLLLQGTQSTGQGAIAELLKQGSEVKPSLYRNHGDTISITIARYIDFSNVYRLKPTQVR